MSFYILSNKDKALISFEYSDNEIPIALLNKEMIDYLPLPLKRILIDINGCVDNESSNNQVYVLNENGCYFIENWLMNRKIPINRENIDKYTEYKNKLTEYMLENNAFSLTDNYWIKEIDSELNWEDILNKRNSVDEYATIKVGNKEYYKGHNSTLGGQLEKYWYRENGILMLCKKTSKTNDILNAREVLASLIYKKQGNIVYTSYNFVKDSSNEICGCKCPAFIVDDNKELISAYDLLEEYGQTQNDNCYELIIEYANKYGIDKNQVQKYLDTETIIDYLITNRDRHQNNIAFIMDSNSRNIIAPAPIFDNGSSVNLEGIAPEGINNTKINGLFHTEKELLAHVKNFSIIDISKLPKEKDIRFILNQCQYISNIRKEQLVHLYLQKKERLSQLQELTKTMSSKEAITQLFNEDCPKLNDIINLDF